MPNEVNDRPHEPFQDLLAAAAFGTLTGEEWASLRGHLDTCTECRAELADFQVIAGALPVTLDEREPSPRLRNRILVLVQQEHRPSDPNMAMDPSPEAAAPPAETSLAPLPSRSGPVLAPRPLRRSYLLIAAALALLSLLAGAALGRYLLADEAGPDGESIALRFPTPIPNVEAELTYLPDERVFMLEMENMPAAPAGQVYQVWLIDNSGPVPAGVMDNPDGEFALAANRDRYSELRITVEPAPLGSPGPTTDPILVAPFSEPDSNAP